MPRRVFATDAERIEAQREYKRNWYALNQERERHKMRERYARKKADDQADGLGAGQAVAVGGA